MFSDEVGVVIPVGPGRRQNVELCLQSLANSGVEPVAVVLVYDGPEVRDEHEGLGNYGLSMGVTTLPKWHEPGDEQPRNVGVRVLKENWPECEYVWFLDTDILVEPETFDAILATYASHGFDDDFTGAVVVCPYDWMPEGHRQPMHDLHNDPRWEMFRQSEGKVYTNDLSAGLACFSGNLVWPISEFERVGGYWSEIHHGRCEDGELGLRAVAMGVPIILAPLARGYHMGHPINIERTLACNARDVPMLNARHPWVEGADVFVVEEDGRRFNVNCRCGESVNTGAWWDHAAACHGDLSLPVQVMSDE